MLTETNMQRPVDGAIRVFAVVLLGLAITIATSLAAAAQRAPPIPSPISSIRCPAPS